MLKKFFRLYVLMFFVGIWTAENSSQPKNVHNGPVVQWNCDKLKAENVCLICSDEKYSPYICTAHNQHLICDECYKELKEQICTYQSSVPLEEEQENFKNDVFKTTTTCNLDELYRLVQQEYPTRMKKEITSNKDVVGLTDEGGNTLLMKALQSSHDNCKTKDKDHDELQENFSTCSSELQHYCMYFIEHSSPEQLMHINKEGKTPLIIALQRGHEELVHSLIDVNVKNRIMILLSNKIEEEKINEDQELSNDELLEQQCSFGINDLSAYKFDAHTRKEIEKTLADSASPLHSKLVSILSNNVRTQARAICTVKSKDAWQFTFFSSSLNEFKKAIENNNINLVAMYLDYGFMIKDVYHFSETGPLSKDCISLNICPLPYACQKGFLEMVKLLVNAGFCIKHVQDDSAKGKCYKTPLMEACENGHHEIVKFLIEKGADVNQVMRSDSRAFAFKYAYDKLLDAYLENNTQSIKNQLHVLNLLIANKVNVNHSLQGKILHYFFYKIKQSSHKTDLIEILKHEQGIYPELCKLCLDSDNVFFVDLLIKVGADLNYDKAMYYPPLYFALHREQYDVFAHLRKKGAKLEEKDAATGNTILMQACNHLSLCKSVSYIFAPFNHSTDNNEILRFIIATNKNGEDALSVMKGREKRANPEKKQELIKIVSLLDFHKKRIIQKENLEHPTLLRKCVSKVASVCNQLYLNLNPIYLQSYGLSSFYK